MLNISEVVVICVIVLCAGMLIGSGWNQTQAGEECTLYGKSKINGIVYSCIEHKGDK